MIFQELMVYWLQARVHLEATAPRQEFLNVLRKVNIIALFYYQRNVVSCGNCFDVLQRKLIKGYVLGDLFFEAKLDLFHKLLRNYRESFIQLEDERPDRDLF